jgi:PncC family amidohydrolase
MSENLLPSLEENVGRLLLARGLTLGTAESCTGGGIGERVTAVSGSSAYYLGGIIAYHNTIKESRLRVSAQTLITHGAVSEQTAQEMARGARLAVGASVGLSVTGIAGPTGGTPEKPVGTVFIGVSSDKGEEVHHFVFSGDRRAVRMQSEDAALALLRDHLQSSASKDLQTGTKKP